MTKYIALGVSTFLLAISSVTMAAYGHHGRSGGHASHANSRHATAMHRGGNVGQNRRPSARQSNHPPMKRVGQRMPHANHQHAHQPRPQSHGLKQGRRGLQHSRASQQGKQHGMQGMAGAQKQRSHNAQRQNAQHAARPQHQKQTKHHNKQQHKNKKNK